MMGATATTKRYCGRLRDILRPLVIAAALLATAQVASAIPSIVWSGAQEIDSGYLELDFNQDSIVDFIYTFVFPLAEFQVTSQGSNRSGTPLTAGTMIDQELSDYWIDGTQPMTQWIRLLDDTTVSFGSWAGIERGYMGLEFEISGHTHYGWAQITSVYDSPTVIIHDWAYETQPGVGIAAGAIPEPSSTALFCLGGLGLVTSLFHRARDGTKS